VFNTGYDYKTEMLWFEVTHLCEAGGLSNSGTGRYEGMLALKN
jgi:hypothetical protein